MRIWPKDSFSNVCIKLNKISKIFKFKPIKDTKLIFGIFTKTWEFFRIWESIEIILKSWTASFPLFS